MILGFSVSVSIAAVHTGDGGLNSTWSKNFLFNIFLKYIIMMKVTSTELQDVK